METKELLQKYHSLLGELDQEASKPWGGNEDHLRKSDYFITPEIVEHFADYAIQSIGFEGGNDFPAELFSGSQVRKVKFGEDFEKIWVSKFKTYLSTSLKNLFGHPFAEPDEVISLLTMDGVVGGRGFAIELAGKKFFTSSHIARVASRAYTVRGQLGKWPGSLLEIGGGHGRFIRDIAKCSDRTKLFYCDLPFNMLLAARYLSKVFPGKVNLVWLEGDEIDENSQINIVSPHLIHRLPSDIEICCNFLSFQHMSEENLAYYWSALEEKSVKQVLHLNRNRHLHPGEVDLTDYPFGRFKITHEQNRASIYVTDTEGNQHPNEFFIVEQHLELGPA